MRIVSLLPSTTEILYGLGAGNDIVGVTFECDYPAAARGTRIVSTSSLPCGLTPAEIDLAVSERLAAGEDLYHLDAGALADLDADVVVTQDLCAVCAVDVGVVDEALAHLGCAAQVVTVDPHTLAEVLDSIEQLGAVCGRQAAASELVAGLRGRLDAVAATVRGQPRPRALVLEWTDPPFAPGHWVPEMVEAAGGTSVLGVPAAPSQRVGWEAVRASAPEVIVSAPCGFALPASVALAGELVAGQQLPAHVPVWAVDANASFARPGPRLVDGVQALAAIMHPAILHPELGAPDPRLARRIR
ncbi:MAG: ABC transporter substrate-binding protein [Nocardioidaceae bacterium]|nr:ABC transporter substrate-binding protein [Nocardioidaceae bacterium]